MSFPKESGRIGEPSVGAVRLEDVRDRNAGQRQQNLGPLADEVEGMMAGSHTNLWCEWTTRAASEGRLAVTLGVYPLRT